MILWRILRATATIGGWVLAALALAWLERVVAPPRTGPVVRDLADDP